MKKPFSNKKIGALIKLIAIRVIKIMGVLFLILFLLSLTDIPFYQYRWLGVHNCELEKTPDYIVLLGGGGMPSADGLLRGYYAAGAWHRAPNAEVIVAIPPDTSNQHGSPELQLANELMMRRVDSAKIRFERSGYNTISQARAIKSFFTSEALDTLSLRLVTSPEHMYRSVKVFRKLGFKNVGGSPTFGSDLKAKALTKDDKDRSFWLTVRYNLWSYMQYEILVLREYSAIAFYKIRGWI